MAGNEQEVDNVRLTTLLSLLQIEESLLQQYRVIFYAIAAIFLPTAAAFLDHQPTLSLILASMGWIVTACSFHVVKERGLNATYFRVLILALENPSVKPSTPFSTSLPLCLHDTAVLTNFKRWQYSEPSCIVLKEQFINAYYQNFLKIKKNSLRRRLFDGIIPLMLLAGFTIMTAVSFYRVV